jgi:hypothetical protein
VVIRGVVYIIYEKERWKTKSKSNKVGSSDKSEENYIVEEYQRKGLNVESMKNEKKGVEDDDAENNKD